MTNAPIKSDVLYSEDKPEICKVMVASTGHISETTRDDFGECKWRPVSVHPFPEGWWVYVSNPHDHITALPADIQALFIKARRHDCRWVQLDADGPKYDDLPLFDW